MAKHYRPVSFLSVVCCVFEKLVNNRLVDRLKNCGFLSDFQYGIWSSQPTAVLLKVLSNSIARAFNRSGDIQAVALNISRSFNRVLHAGLLRKRKSYRGIMEFLVWYLAFFHLFSVIDSFEWFWMESLHKNTQLYWCSSRLQSWSHTFPFKHQRPSRCYL